MVLLYIGLGGALGALARYGVSGWIQQRVGFEFPWGTLVVNLVGSLLIGFSLHYMESVRFTPEVRAALTIGILGAFTTFSTFSYETVALLENAAWTRAFLYAAGSLLLGLGSVYAGIGAAGLVLHARG